MVVRRSGRTPIPLNWSRRDTLGDGDEYLEPAWHLRSVAAHGTKPPGLAGRGSADGLLLHLESAATFRWRLATAVGRFHPETHGGVGIQYDRQLVRSGTVASRASALCDSARGLGHGVGLVRNARCLRTRVAQAGG